MEKKKKKTQTITFRLESGLVEEIRKDAELEKINVNALVTKILANHVLWERYERKLGLLPMTKPFVRYSINKMKDEEITKLAEEVEKETFSDILNFMRGEYTIEEFIEIIRSWLYVAWMQHDVLSDRSGYTLKIYHDLGEKWSLYVKTLITELFHDVVQKSLDVKSAKNRLVFKFPRE